MWVSLMHVMEMCVMKAPGAAEPRGHGFWGFKETGRRPSNQAPAACACLTSAVHAPCMQACRDATSRMCATCACAQVTDSLQRRCGAGLSSSWQQLDSHQQQPSKRRGAALRATAAFAQQLG